MSAALTPSFRMTGQRRLLSTSCRTMSERISPHPLSPVQLPLPVKKAKEMEIGAMQHCRYRDYYQQSLQRDLLYLTYDHDLERQDRNEQMRIARRIKRTPDPTNPYNKHTPLPPNKGNKSVPPVAYNYKDDVVEISHITMSTRASDAVRKSENIHARVALVRAITGLPVMRSRADPALWNQFYPQDRGKKGGYIRVLTAKRDISHLFLRKGKPIGVQAFLPSKPAYDFLEVLTTFVLPRMRDFRGFLLPGKKRDNKSPDQSSGTITLNFSSDAWPFFPQTELNWESYPLHQGDGFQLDIVTNQRGRRATEKAQQLLSGLGIPFVRNDMYEQ